jgi:hypothetical protein
VLARKLPTAVAQGLGVAFVHVLTSFARSNSCGNPSAVRRQR